MLVNMPVAQNASHREDGFLQHYLDTLEAGAGKRGVCLSQMLLYWRRGWDSSGRLGTEATGNPVP